MYRANRLNEIMGILKKKKEISTVDLQNELFLSQSTLRRDLIFLEKRNLIRRDFGYVYILSNSNIEFSYDFRELKNEKAKREICKRCADLIDDNMAVFVDSSSTVNYLPNYISGKYNLTFITNGLKIASQLNQLSSTRLFILGGEVPPLAGSSVGSMVNDQINHFHANISIMSFGGLMEHNIFITDQEQSTSRLAMLRNSEKKILLMDSSKFNKKDFINFGSISQFDVFITNQKPENELLDYAKNHNIKIIY